jgi:hypothetical protein
MITLAFAHHGRVCVQGRASRKRAGGHGGPLQCANRGGEGLHDGGAGRAGGRSGENDKRLERGRQSRSPEGVPDIPRLEGTVTVSAFMLLMSTRMTSFVAV